MILSLLLLQLFEYGRLWTLVIGGLGARREEHLQVCKIVLNDPARSAIVKQNLTCLGMLSMLLALGVETVRNTSFQYKSWISRDRIVAFRCTHTLRLDGVGKPQSRRTNVDRGMV